MILIDLEQDLQNRDNQRKGEQVQDGGKDVEKDIQHQIPLIGGNETAQDAHEISHGSTTFCLGEQKYRNSLRTPNCLFVSRSSPLSLFS